MNQNVVKVPYKGTLAFYRRLLKTMMKTFDGDYVMFHRIRLEARRKILENKDERDEFKIHDQIFFGEETRDFLEKNLIKGEVQENGRVKLKARKEHSLSSPIKH
eukprot:TRINITY_DN9258_c0_g1_i1.p1 TRINITY_DN9258_c0_g1~~TRINITY_DN9258_c0_g1_i1.p1  ORF type:complete len:104 (-),score=15.51 TRINITY_DN9258_c0_g1_i1:92-403(-)